MSIALPGTLFSQIGEQPGAVATVAKTLLAKDSRLGTVWLFPSPHTEHLAAALRQHLSGLGLAVEVSPPAEHTAQAVAARVRDACRSGPAWFNCSAGMSYFVGKVSHALRDLPQAQALHASFTSLHAVGGGWHVPLEDFGLEPLLGLHGLGFRAEGSDGPVHRGVTLHRAGPGGGPILSASFAYELRGRLFCLFQGVDSLDAARQLLDIRKRRGELAELQPHLTAETASWHVANRLHLAGVDVLFKGSANERQALEAKRRLDRWLARQPPEPGRRAPRSPEGAQESLLFSHPGAGGEGHPLVVCLGNDPGATLQALWAHRPRVAWILFDKTTPYVRALAERLAAVAKSLPVGELRFVPVSHVGKGIDPASLAGHLDGHAAVYANVTPGTKAQAWALARLDDAQVTACSLDTRGAPQVVRLQDDEALPGTRWAVPDLLTQAAVRGGPLADPGTGEETLRGRAGFLGAVAAPVAELARRDKKGLFVLWPNRGWSQASTEDKLLRWRRRDSGPAADHTLLEVEVIGPDVPLVRGEFRLPLGENKKTRQKEPKAGVWLEELVGHAFLSAGARDVHVGMVWGWPEKPRQQRTEMDLVCRWGDRGLVGVSVKASALTQVQRARCCREISAMGYECLGRLALPVLVSGRRAAALEPAAVLGEFEETGVLELGIGHLDHPATVRHLVESAFEQLRKAAPTTTSPRTAGSAAAP
jgi:hypothetical protein